MYAYMMELDNPKLLLVHLKDDGYDIIDIPYMKDTVKELLKIRAFQVTQLE
jgi:hypothetical protein